MSIPEYTTDQSIKSDKQVVEISLKDIAFFIKESRLTILIATLVGFVLGGIYAFSKPNVYTSEVTVMPEVQAKATGGLGSLGSLAGLAGVNIDNFGQQSDAIHPDIYPNVLQSNPFALTLLKDSVYSEKLNAKTTLQEFMMSTKQANLIEMVFGTTQPANEASARTNSQLRQILQITREQEGLLTAVQNAVITTYDKKTGLVTIAATEPDPFVAATVAKLSLDYLTSYIVNYRTEKFRQQVRFLEKQVNDAQSNYKTAEYAIATYRDQNRNLYLNTAKISEQRLQADYLLAQTVYSDLAKQLEQAKIRVQEETPVFKILDPPTVPLVKSAPKRTFIILGFAVSAAMLSVIILLIRQVKQAYNF
ncbi:GNVR domain-containing protein [Fibrella forsythiae]|uniref:Lipopolysaccharide biosynthesis protein n=1 Tax=Fibrella forsythiae TaxID=2817061 RepID=A0ABS3JIL9_9BACT|nr:GNVR domain-containing protein [Fibrella forsythiae]MBO0949258.1 lipopolysaccharide biosynthesis protein [Fibrella forsythiae]